MKMGLVDLQAIEIAQNRQGNVWNGLAKKQPDLERLDKKAKKLAGGMACLSASSLSWGLWSNDLCPENLPSVRT